MCAVCFRELSNSSACYNLLLLLRAAVRFIGVDEFRVVEVVASGLSEWVVVVLRRFFGFGLFWQQYGMNVGQDTTGRDRDAAEQLVQFLIVANGERNVPWHDTGLFVVTGGVTGQFENLSAQILEHGRQIHGSARPHAGRVFALSEIPTDTTHGELQAGLGRGRSALLVSTTAFSFSFAGHGCWWMMFDEARSLAVAQVVGFAMCSAFRSRDMNAPEWAEPYGGWTMQRGGGTASTLRRSP
jgi:hypothetical protein